MHKAESNMSAATNNDAAGGTGHGQRGGNDEFPSIPISLADLQDDDDKSSLESGQVSPEAFDERDNINASNSVNAPFAASNNQNNRFNASGGSGTMGRPDPSSDK